MNERNGTADLLKGFAVLCMVQVHLTEVMALPEIYNSIVGQISLFLGGPPAAPVFMAVMGCFLYQTKKSFIDQFTRGFLLFAGGIFLNVALNSHLLYHTYLGHMDHDPYKYIFGADILTLAGLSIILISFVKHYLKRNIYFIILFVLVLVLTPFINKGIFIDPFIQAYIGGYITWSYFPLFPWLAYPLAGYIYAHYLKRGIFKPGKKTLHIIIYSLVFVVAAGFPFAFPISYNIYKYYHHEFLYSLWMIAFVYLTTLGFYWIDLKSGASYITRFLKWIGKNVTSFYVVQWILIGNLATDIYQTQGLKELGLWFVIITGVSALVVYIYKRFSPGLSIAPTPEAENL